MQAAHDGGVDGIVGDCGGCLSCATCHVFVDPEYLDRLPGPSATENEMLDYAAAGRESNSRLSCQIFMSEQLEGVSVRIAYPQV
jgi:Ferredoxin